MLQYIIFNVAVYSFTMLHYIVYIICDVALKVFRALGTGVQWGTVRGEEQGQGRGGE